MLIISPNYFEILEQIVELLAAQIIISIKNVFRFF